MIIVNYLVNKKVKTKNIADTISRIATENNIPESALQFKIEDVETYIKTVADDEFKLYVDDKHNYYTDCKKLIDEDVEHKQFYQINITDNLKSIVKLKYDIKYSNNAINPYIILHPESKIPYRRYKPKEIFFYLLNELNRIKAKNKIIIKIFDEEMKAKLKIFVKYLYKGKFNKKIKLPLFRGIEPEFIRSAKLIMRYLKKDTNSQVIEVDKEEVLVEFIKPIFSENGFNSFGKIITDAYLKNEEDLKCKVDTNSIEIIENDDKKLYKSKIKGYVHLDKELFYVDNKIEMKHISSVDNTLTIEEDNNISVIVSQEDTSLDSIGEGVELTSENIHITGHVGSGATLKAVNLEIDGATHQNSLQEAKFAKINRHKGKLRCHEAKIKLLEGGEVQATNVNIESSLGGSVYAENVTIGVVKNNLKVYASNSITINLVSGEDNLFKINYGDIPTLSSKYNFLTIEIDELKHKLEGAQKHTPKSVPIIKEKINKLKNIQNKMTNAVKHATITINKPLRGLNTITFTIDEEHELTYKTDARSYKPFYLKESDNTITMHPVGKKISLEN
jgi:hypothetical protein